MKRLRASAAAPHEVIVIATTVGTQQQALDIAQALVHRRLVACVNILPNVRSIFRWKGKIHDDGEFMLLIKTVPERFEAVKNAIREIHTYELPEILGHSVALAEPSFAAWIDEMSRPAKRAPRKKDGAATAATATAAAGAAAAAAKAKG